MKRIQTYEEFLNESSEFYGEEFINEAFQSSILQRLTKEPAYTGGPLKKYFFDSLSKMGIDASRIKDEDLISLDPNLAEKWTKNNPDDILIYYSTRGKENPYVGKYGMDSSYKSINQNYINANTILGVIINKVYVDAKRGTKGNVGSLIPSTDSRLGIEKTKGAYGANINTLKKIASLSDIVYVISPSKIPNSTKLRTSREESKMGATALINPKDFKRNNINRYHDILIMRAASDNVDDMAKEALEILNKMVFKALDEKIMDEYGRIVLGKSMGGYQQSLDSAGNISNYILRKYKDYVDNKSEEERYKDRDKPTSDYHRSNAGKAAKEIKHFYDVLKLGYIPS